MGYGFDIHAEMIIASLSGVFIIKMTNTYNLLTCYQIHLIDCAAILRCDKYLRRHDAFLCPSYPVIYMRYIGAYSGYAKLHSCVSAITLIYTPEFILQEHIES